MGWNLKFISEEELVKHVKFTILKYGEKLESYDLKKFNSNLIDPIKLIFDKTVYRSSWEEIVKNEIFRQNDTMYIFSFNTINGSNFKCLHI